MRVKFEKRPICSCGVKMKLVEYVGYYDSFKYWCCENAKCSLDDVMAKAEPDGDFRGSYA
jgi:hypothetical protein